MNINKVNEVVAQVAQIAGTEGLALDEAIELLSVHGLECDELNLGIRELAQNGVRIYEDLIFSTTDLEPERVPQKFAEQVIQDQGLALHLGLGREEEWEVLLQTLLEGPNNSDYYGAWDQLLEEARFEDWGRLEEREGGVYLIVDPLLA